MRIRMRIKIINIFKITTPLAFKINYARMSTKGIIYILQELEREREEREKKEREERGTTPEPITKLITENII